MQDALTRTETEKMELLLLWCRDAITKSGENYILMKEFDRRYKYLFGEYPLWYTWGPFYRDHGFAGIKEERK